MPEDVKSADVTNGTMSFSSDGIFVKGDDGVERQVFLYKKDYRLQQYGKPRFHICRCEVIEDFISSGRFKQHYVRANSEPVPVIDVDSGRRLVKIDSLPLCNYCRKILSGYGGINSTQFVDLLKSANKQHEDIGEVELDLFGYTRDWDDISRQYREKHDYTCESCGLRIEDVYDRQFMHVHHINGDKLNNKDNNLKCLCLYCHAHVDDHHYQRLTTGANKYAYYPFVDRYGDDGHWRLDDVELRKIHDEAKKIYRGMDGLNDPSQSVISIKIENHFEGEIDTLTING